ncbi:uncharacterized protein [Nicotiana tomentosiformis]|uniref:uncharacterized protein n=1 Tax=Nicotiana tomentosiformis TaxID=4098 RepID=UPI00388C88A3
MNEVGTLSLFNEAQQALNRINQLEFEFKEQAQKKDMYKLRSEQQGGAMKDLQAELDRAQKEASTLRRKHADLVEKVKVFEVKNDELAKYQPADLVEMNEVQAMADGWKSKMDLLASKKETAQANLASVEVQLRVAKEKADKWSQLNDDLREQLSLAVVERDTLGREYVVMKSKLDTTSADAKEMVAQYKADVEEIEMVRGQERAEREANKPRGQGGFSGAPQGGQFQQGQFQQSQSSFSALPAQASHYAPPAQLDSLIS